MNEPAQNPISSGINRTGIPPQEPVSESHWGRNTGIVGFFIIVILLGGAWYITEEGRATDKALQTATAYVSGGEYENAKNTLYGALTSYPRSVSLHLALADVSITEARRNAPPTDDAKREKVAQDIRTALAQIESSLGENGSEYHSLVGATYLLSGDPTSALAHFEDSLTIDPTNIRAMVNTGVTFEMTGDVEKAYKFYQKAEGVLNASQVGVRGDTSGELFIHLGKMAAIGEGDGEKSRSYFEKAIAAAASNALKAEGHYALSTIAYQEGKIDESRAHGEQAIAVDPKSDWGYISVLRAMIIKPIPGDDVKANKYIFTAVQLNPTRAFTRFLYGQIAHRAGNTDQAVASYGDALRLINTGADHTLSKAAKSILRSDIYSYLALAYQTDGKIEEATAAINSAFQGNPVKIAYLVEHAEPFAVFKKMFNIK